MSNQSGTSDVGAIAPLMLSISGCRGIFGRTMTPEVAARYGMVLGAYLREQRAAAGGGGGGADARTRVVIGRDGRLAGSIIAQAAAAGLAASGCDVLDLGVAMTASVGIMVDRVGAAGGLVVTASHNPQQWNGLKPIVRELSGPRAKPGAVSACAPDKAMADQVIARFKAAVQTGAHGVDPASAGRVELAPSGAALGLGSAGVNAHLEIVRQALQDIGVVDDRRMQSVSCVVDSVNASGVEGAAMFLGQRLKHHLGAGDNGIFPHAPEPLKENLTHLAKFTLEKRADAGFAQDPDADRLAIIDERGTYIGEEYTLALAGEALLGAMQAQGKATAGAVICTNLSTSRMIEDVVARYGARVIRTPVGEANVVEAMKAHGAVLGGEGNGGVIWPAVTYIRDSIGAMGLVLALLARTGKPLSAVVADIPTYAIVKRKVDLPDPAAAVRAAGAVAKRFADQRLDTRDGVRVDFERSPSGKGRAWLHVRGSNTEPIMRLIAEAPTTADAEAILGDAERAIGG